MRAPHRVGRMQDSPFFATTCWMTKYLRVGCRMVRKRGEAGIRSLSLSGQDVGILGFFFWAGNGMDDDN